MVMGFKTFKTSQKREEKRIGEMWKRRETSQTRQVSKNTWKSPLYLSLQPVTFIYIWHLRFQLPFIITTMMETISLSQVMWFWSFVLSLKTLPSQTTKKKSLTRECNHHDHLHRHIFTRNPFTSLSYHFITFSFLSQVTTKNQKQLNLEVEREGLFAIFLGDKSQTEECLQRSRHNK